MTDRNRKDSASTSAIRELKDQELDQVAGGAKEEMLEFPGVKKAVLKNEPGGSEIKTSDPEDAALDPQKQSFGGNAAEGSSHV